MSDGMLGTVIGRILTLSSGMLGALGDLLQKLNSSTGAYWFVALKKFLRREDPWGSSACSGVLANLEEFNPGIFFQAEGWSVFEQDHRSLKLDELNLNDVRLEHMFRRGEARSIEGEVWLDRLKRARYLRLDARFFLFLWKNNEFIPESWYSKTNGNTTNICFPGTVLVHRDGGHYVFSLDFSGHSQGWKWRILPLDESFFSEDLAAVIV